MVRVHVQSRRHPDISVQGHVSSDQHFLQLTDKRWSPGTSSSREVALEWMLKTSMGCKKRVSVLSSLLGKWQEVDGVLQAPPQINNTEKGGRRNDWAGAVSKPFVMAVG